MSTGLSVMWQDEGAWIALGVSALFVVAGLLMHRVFVKILKQPAPEAQQPPQPAEPEKESP